MNYSVYDISNCSLLLFSIIIVVPIIIDRYLDARLIKSIIFSVLRMIVQLIFVGFYLTYVFKLNSIVINIAWILMMIAVANFSVLNHTGLKVKNFFIVNYFVYVLTVILIQCAMLIVFDVNTMLNSRYIIPLQGMIMGNLLKCNIIGIDRFFSEIRNRKDEYILYVSLGATPNEALKIFWNSAYKAAIQPQLASLATIGLVALPGMMTGQMLGGSEPLTAVKYQILIMMAIFASASLSLFLNLYYSRKMTIDSFGRIREDIYTKL